MIHKNRGNRRRVDKRKRRHKYNLVRKIWGDATTFLGGVLGKYDKGKIHDQEDYRKPITEQRLENVSVAEDWAITIHTPIKEKLNVVKIRSKTTKMVGMKLTQ